MAVKLIDSALCSVNYGQFSAAMNLTNRTWATWLKYSSFDEIVGATLTLLPLDSPAEWCGFHQTKISSTYYIELFVKWSVSIGVWGFPIPVDGEWHHYSFSYNNSSASNDPVMYLDGVSQVVTERITPSGSYVSGTNVDLMLGADDGTTVGDVYVGSWTIYNRILSAAEIADAYNSRLAIPNYNGLVFAPNLNSAAGLQTFDGATLSGTNYLRDTISGATGTPSGSPVGAADTYLNWK